MFCNLHEAENSVWANFPQLLSHSSGLPSASINFDTLFMRSHARLHYTLVIMYFTPFRMHFN